MSVYNFLNTAFIVATPGNDVVLPLPAVGELTLIDTSLKGEAREGLYQFTGTGADPSVPLMLRLGHYPNATSTNISLKLTSFVEEVDGAESLGIKPWNMTIAFSTPCKTGVPDSIAMAEWAFAAACILAKLASKGAEDGVVPDVFDDLKFGVVSTLTTHPSALSNA